MGFVVHSIWGVLDYGSEMVDVNKYFDLFHKYMIFFICIGVEIGYACGGQRSILRVIPPVLSTLAFETMCLTGLELTR